MGQTWFGVMGQAQPVQTSSGVQNHSATFTPKGGLPTLALPPTQIFNLEAEHGVDYYQNLHYMRSRILQENGKSENIPYFEMPVCPKVKELVGYLRPVHRCAIATFKSILQTGTLDSREVRSSIAEDPYAALEKKVPADSRIYCWMLSFTKDKPVEPLVDWVVASSKQALARIQFQSSEASDRAQRRQSLETLTAAVNQLELEVKYFYGWSQLTSKLSDALNRVVEALPEEVQAALDALISHFRQLLGLPDKHGALWVYLSSLSSGAVTNPAEAAAMIAANWENVRSRLPADVDPFLHMMDQTFAKEAASVRSLNSLMQKLGERAEEHASNVFHGNTPGIGYFRDLELGTNKQVFSIVGAHFEQDYGDIMIVLEQTVMCHPDFNMTPCAGTGFASGNAKTFNTWLPKSDVEEFHRCKLNAGVRGWRSVMASALANACRVHYKRGSIEEVDQNDLLMFMAYENSHCLIEGHLPPLLPLKGYAAQILIPRSSYQQLTGTEEERLLELMDGESSRIVVTDSFLTPLEILGACIFTSPSALSNGFAVNAMPSERPWRLPARAKCPGTMKLTFTLSALHVQVALLDDNHLGFVIGIGKMVKFEDSPSAQLMQLGFDGTWLDDAANDGSAEEILQERSCLVEETDGETCSLWLSGNCHPLHSVFKASPDVAKAEGTFDIQVCPQTSSIMIMHGSDMGLFVKMEEPESRRVLSQLSAVEFRALYGDAKITNIKVIWEVASICCEPQWLLLVIPI